MSKINELHKKYLSSEKLGVQIFGALIQWRGKALIAFLLLVVPLSIGVFLILSPGDDMAFLYLMALNLMVWLTIKVCRSLTEAFSLRKNESGITWCYISVLVSVMLWLIGFALIFNIKDDDKAVVAIGVIGSMLTWIFQDRIKGAMVFVHLRMNRLLNIGDLVVVPKYNVNGEVKRISLTTVTVYNEDTSTSTLPISVLHSDHFINYQNMVDGKTYGRKMSKTFILDTSWFRLLPKEETDNLINKINEAETAETTEKTGKESIYDNLPLDAVECGMLNAKLYRIYLFHWLMNHKHISQQPYLVVCWKDPVEGGMPLEINAFITDRSLVAYEWQQSQIIEHVIEALDWFGLRLFQSPSAFDANNKNVYMSQKQPTHRKEMTDEKL